MSEDADKKKEGKQFITLGTEAISWRMRLCINVTSWKKKKKKRFVKFDVTLAIKTSWQKKNK